MAKKTIKKSENPGKYTKNERWDTDHDGEITVDEQATGSLQDKTNRDAVKEAKNAFKQGDYERAKSIVNAQGSAWESGDVPGGLNKRRTKDFNDLMTLKNKDGTVVVNGSNNSDTTDSTDQTETETESKGTNPLKTGMVDAVPQVKTQPKVQTSSGTGTKEPKKSVIEEAKDFINNKVAEGRSKNADRADYYDKNNNVNGLTGDNDNYTNSIWEGVKTGKAVKNYRNQVNAIKDKYAPAQNELNSALSANDDYNHQLSVAESSIAKALQGNLEGSVKSAKDSIENDRIANLRAMEELEQQYSTPDGAQSEEFFNKQKKLIEEKHNLSTRENDLQELLKDLYDEGGTLNYNQLDSSNYGSYAGLAEKVNQTILSLGQVASGNLEVMNNVVSHLPKDNPLSEGVVEDYNQLTQLHDAFYKIMEQDQPLSDEQVQAIQNELESINDQINEDLNSDEVLGAKDDMIKQINKFAYYLFDDLKTMFYCYIGVANGNFTPLYSALEKRNASYSEAETKYDNDILNAFSQNNVKDITGEADANYNLQQIMPNIVQQDVFNKLDASKQKYALEGMKEMFDQYQAYLNEGGNDGFAAWYTAQTVKKDNINSWPGLILELVRTGALNFDAIQNFFNSVVPGMKNPFAPNTSTEEPSNGGKVGMITGGKAEKWMDKAWNNSLPEQEPQPNPTVSLDKQAMLAQAAQSRGGGQVPQGQAQVQPQQGWGGTQQA